MKNLILSVALLSFSAFLFVGCEGPAGPAGSDGKDGVDGNLSCLVCHTKNHMDSIRVAFATSQHYLGDIAVDYAGGRSSCARCHSHEGFANYVIGATAVDISNQTSWKCNTCHDNHSSLEDGIEAPLVINDSVTFLTDGSNYDFGRANLCATCHQSRSTGSTYDKYTSDTSFTRTFTKTDIAAYDTAAFGPKGSATLNSTKDTLTVVFDVPKTNVYISSTHAGPHHGPQSNTIAGIGGYITGTTSVQEHKNCINCHMNKDHSFRTDVTTCDKCHGKGHVETIQSAVETRMHAIEAKLESIHALHDGHPMYASITRAQFKAFWNYMIVEEDRSMGIHNKEYIEAMLTEAETLLGL